MSNVVAFDHQEPETAALTFDDFWREYPRRVGKPLAKVKWDAITGPGLKTKTYDRGSGTYVEIELKATPEEIIEGVRRYRKTQIDPNTYRLKDGGKFTCYPATWLNAGRWLDEE